MKDHKESNSKAKEKTLEDEINTGITKESDGINTANTNSKDNVAPSTRSKLEDRRHGREHGEPLTGSTPKTD